MSGRVENPIDINRRVYERNLSYAIELFENENILGLIEPINEFTVPNYYLNSYDLGNQYSHQFSFKLHLMFWKFFFNVKDSN